MAESFYFGQKPISNPDEHTVLMPEKAKIVNVDK